MSCLSRRPGYPLPSISQMRIPGVSTTKGLVSTAMPGSRSPFLTATFSAYAAIEAAEAELADPAVVEFWTAVNYSVINRVAPELATDR